MKYILDKIVEKEEMDMLDGLSLTQIIEQLSIRNTASLAIAHRFARSIAESKLAIGKEKAKQQRSMNKLHELRDFLDTYNESIRREGAEVFFINGMYVSKDHPKRTTFYAEPRICPPVTLKKYNTGITVIMRSLPHATFDFIMTITLDGSTTRYDMYVLKHAKTSVKDAFYNNFTHATKNDGQTETVEVARGIAMEFPLDVLQRIVNEIHTDDFITIV